MKSDLISGKGQFCPPASNVFTHTYIRNYVSGTKQVQECQAGEQKITKRKARMAEPDADGMLLIYSIGDEMYKWCRPGSIHGLFEAKRDICYRFPVGWGGKNKSFHDHLIDFKQNGFHGRAALEAATEWRSREKAAQQKKQEHQQRQEAFSRIHRIHALSDSDDESQSHPRTPSVPSPVFPTLPAKSACQTPL